MTVVSQALKYASRGWSVLALNGIKDGKCACGDDECRTPGKHPRGDLYLHAVLDADCDAEKISRWPDDCNVGIALGDRSNGLMAFDIDVEAIARDVLATTLGDRTLVTRTRRGAHVLFLTTGDRTGFHIKGADGTKIGSIQGNGQYIVAPPSMSETGRAYEFVGRPPGLHVTDDPLKYITSVLKQVGVDAEQDLDILVFDFAELPDGPVKAAMLPETFKTADLSGDLRNELAFVRRAMRGELGRPRKDRSGAEWRAAATIWKAARELEINMSVPEFAGYIKQLDTAWARKFSEDVARGVRTEAAADRMMLRHAYKYMAAERGETPSQTSTNGTEQAETAPIVSMAATPRAAEYFWDQQDGILYHQPNPERGAKPVANFNPSIVAQCVIDRGDGAIIENAWRVRCVHATGEFRDFLILPSDLDRGMFEKRMNRTLTPAYIIRAGMHDRLREAFQLLSIEKYTEEVVVASTGWIERDGERLFVMQGCSAITAKGMDEDVGIDYEILGDLPGSNITDSALRPYGVGVRVPVSGEERKQAIAAFARLVACGKREVTLPVVLQVLAGPLYSAGVDSVPPLVHVMGKTGSLKTSYCKAALSIFGTFTENDAPPASWSSTAAAIQSLAHEARHLTLLIDDYKVAHADKRAVVSIIQPYVDKSGRRRSTPSQRVQRAQVARGLILSNGEDVWEREASVSARTVKIEVHSQDIEDKKLLQVQRDVVAGRLQLFGGLWLSWLAKQEALFVDKEIDELRRTWIVKLEDALPQESEIHRRILAENATLLAVSDIVIRFADEIAPALAAKLREWLDEIMPSLLAATASQAEEVEQLSPFQQLAESIIAALSSRRAYFAPAGGTHEGSYNMPNMPTQRADCIGWYEGEEVYLSKAQTFQWLENSAHRAGRVLPFTWNAVMQEVRNGLEGKPSQVKQIVSDATGAEGRMRVCVIPLRQFLDTKNTEPDEDVSPQ